MLPILDLEGEIVRKLRVDRPGRRLILSAPTGSGKSTQLPQILLRRGFLDRGEAAVLQPRRIAARMLAARVARELGVPLGGRVGYQVRFERVAGPDTRVLYATEGILLRRIVSDPDLAGVAALVFDEFHERHLAGDVALARALDLQERRRPDLLIVVMSATLDLPALREALAPCETVVSEGRLHPVEIEYLPERTKAAPVWEWAADAFAQKADLPGNALVFMPGAYEIARTIEAVRARPQAKGRDVVPLHGELPPREQDEAVAPRDRPRVIVSTNVAETSLTIEGVRLVIDSGLARIARHDPYRGINTLLVEKISRASADQRAGRAGRTSPGHCIRLWPEREHARRPLRETPEVLRLDLAEVVLAIKAAGIADLRAFRWIEKPDPKAMEHAETLLGDLGALDADGRLTDLGRRMLAFPVHPRTARMLLAAGELGCVREAALVAALTQGRDLLARQEGGRRELFGARGASDFLLLMDAWRHAREQGFDVEACRRAGVHAQTAREVGPLWEQIVKIAESEGLTASGAGEDALRKCVLIGFSDRVARKDPATARCELVRGRSGTLARESVVRDAELLVAAEVREVGGKDLATLLGLAAAIEPAWLEELFPDEIADRVQVSFDPAHQRVVAEAQRTFRGLAFRRKPLERPPQPEAARLLAEEISSGRLALRGWDDEAEQWILRTNLLARTCPELGLTQIGVAERREVVERLCQGASSFKEVKDRPVLAALQDLAGREKVGLVERHAPRRIALPGGKEAKVRYVPDGPPFVSARIQQLFGVARVPAVAMGRIAPAVHILAPNMRPVQVTQDLEGFWRDHYPRVKRELQRRYPKHEWK